MTRQDLHLFGRRIRQGEIESEIIGRSIRFGLGDEGILTGGQRGRDHRGRAIGRRAVPPQLGVAGPGRADRVGAGPVDACDFTGTHVLARGGPGACKVGDRVAQGQRHRSGASGGARVVHRLDGRRAVGSREGRIRQLQEIARLGEQVLARGGGHIDRDRGAGERGRFRGSGRADIHEVVDPVVGLSRCAAGGNTRRVATRERRAREVVRQGHFPGNMLKDMAALDPYVIDSRGLGGADHAVD